jgi:DNA-binding transcriptional regulator YiaG
MTFTESTMQSMRQEAWRRENLVDQHTAAKMIGIDVRTLRRWHDQGIGPKRWHRRFHRKIFYSRVEVSNSQLAIIRIR